MQQEVYTIAFKLHGDRWKFLVMREVGSWRYSIMQNGKELHSSGPDEGSATEQGAKEKLQTYLDEHHGRLINVLSVRWHAGSS